MASKRYAKLLARLVRVEEMHVRAARSVFRELLAARFGDVAELGVTLEAQHLLRHYATDSDIADWQQQVSARLMDDTKLRRKNEFTVGQGIRLEWGEISMLSKGKLQIEVAGELGELLAMQAYLLARTVGLDRLRQCDCGKLFVREGKREFCSERCQKRVYMKRFRAGERSRKGGVRAK